MAWTFTNLTAGTMGLTCIPQVLGPVGSATASWTGNLPYDAINSDEVIHLVGLNALSVVWAADSGAVPGTEMMTRSSDRFYDMDHYSSDWDSLRTVTEVYNTTLDLENKGGSLKATIPDFTRQPVTVSTALGDLRGRPIHYGCTVTALTTAITNYDVLGRVGGANISLLGGQLWVDLGAALNGAGGETLTIDITSDGAGTSLIGGPVDITAAVPGTPTALPLAAAAILANTTLFIEAAYVNGGAGTFESFTVYCDGWLTAETYTKGFTRLPSTFTTAVAEITADAACAAGESATVDIQITGGATILTAPVAVTNATVYPLDLPIDPAALPLLVAGVDLVAIVVHTKGNAPTPWAGVAINIVGQVDTPRQVSLGALPAAAFIRGTVANPNGCFYVSLTEPLSDGGGVVAESVTIDVWNNTGAGASILAAGAVVLTGPQVITAPIALATLGAALAANTELEARITAYTPGTTPTGLGLEIYADYNLQISNFVEGFPTILTAGTMASAKAWVNASPGVGEVAQVDIWNGTTVASMLTAPVNLTSATLPYTAATLTPAVAPGNVLAANAMLEARIAYTSLPLALVPTVTVEFRSSVPAGTSETLNLGSVNRPGTVTGIYVVASNQAAAGESLTVMVTKGTAAGTTNLLSGVMTLNNTITARTRVTGSLSAVAGVTTVAVTDTFEAALTYTPGATPTPLRDVRVVITVRPSDA